MTTKIIGFITLLFFFSLSKAYTQDRGDLDRTCNDAFCEILTSEIQLDRGTKAQERLLPVKVTIPGNPIPQTVYRRVLSREVEKCTRSVTVPRDIYFSFLYALRLLPDDQGDLPPAPTPAQQAWLRLFVTMSDQMGELQCRKTFIAEDEVNQNLTQLSALGATCQQSPCTLFRVVNRFNIGEPSTKLVPVRRIVGGQVVITYVRQTVAPQGGCAKVVNLPKVIFDTFQSAMRMVPDGSGDVRPTLTPTQQAWISFFATLTQQTKNFNCEELVSSDQ